MKPITNFCDLSHVEICEALDVPAFQPAPRWKPYAVQATMIEIRVEGKRVMGWGGAMRCGVCGYGIDIPPEGDECPRCHAARIVFQSPKTT